ncbi:MAG: hypothetical protein PUE73_00515 [Eubacteriales bacterium]|nr:hypothetical protein [Eubacteriales bacterium]
MKKSLVIAMSGIITGLSVVAMFLGSVVWIFSYVMPIVAGLLIIILSASAGKKSGLYVFFATCVLSLILLPDKEPALLYSFFFGYYPLIKDALDGIKSRVLKLGTKFVIFNIAMVASQLVLVYVFGIPFDNFMGKWSWAILLALANVVLVLYDKMFDIVVIVYNRKYRHIFERLLK